MNLAPKMDIIKTHEVDIGLKPKISRKKNKTESGAYFKKHHISKRSMTSNYVANNFVTNKSQKCITKMSFRPSKDLHSKNLQYIQKEGKGIDGNEPKLYGSDDEEFYKKNMADKNWRIILSPQTNNIDLTVLTKEFIKKLEDYSGFKFTWTAANHYDTDNHHTHILINGIDKNGKEVNFLPKGSYPKICSQIAKDLCTQMIGNKTKAQIKDELEKTTVAQRKTFLDDKLLNYMKGNELNKDYINDKKEALLSQRLNYLKSLGLCSYSKETQKFTFQDNWMEELKKLGKYNMYYEGMKIANCPQNKYSLHEVSEKGSISGEIVHKFIRQKDSNNFALVIKKENGEYCFVPLNFYPHNCFPGDTVNINVKNKKTYINNMTRK